MIATPTQTKAELLAFIGQLDAARQAANLIDSTAGHVYGRIAAAEIDALEILLQSRQDAMQVYTRGIIESAMTVTEAVELLQKGQL